MRPGPRQLRQGDGLLRRAGDRRRTCRVDGRARGWPLRRAGDAGARRISPSAAGCSASSREIGGQARPPSWMRSSAELATLPEVRVLRRTTRVRRLRRRHLRGRRAGRRPPAPCPPTHEPRQRLWRIVAQARRSWPPAPSSGRSSSATTTGPGVMLAGAVRSYINRFAVRPGARAVLFGNNDDALRTAATADAGIARRGRRRSPSRCARAICRPCRADRRAARRGRGRAGPSAAPRRRGRRNPHCRGRDLHLACDLIAVSGGWQPTVHLSTHLGGKPGWDAALAAFVPGTLPPGMEVAGAAKGDFALGGLPGGRRAERLRTRPQPAASIRGRSRCPRPMPKARRSRRSGG